MPGSEPRRHHVQPAVLLQQFANNDGQVRVVPKRYGRGPMRLQSVLNVSVRRDLNTLLTDAGPDFSLEQALGSLDAKFPAVFPLLDLARRTAADEDMVRGLIAVQMARDPYLRAWIAEAVRQYFSEVKTALKEREPNLGPVEIERRIEEHARMHVVAKHVVASPENIAVAATGAYIQKMYEATAGCYVTILRSEYLRFILADSPSSLYDHYEYNNIPHEQRSSMTFEDDSELLLPITARHTALISTTSERQLVDVSTDVARIINAKNGAFGRA
jgi:hypothetical protein